MKKVEISDYGAPETVAHCIEAPDVGPPGSGEIVLDVLAFPINPADVLFCRGSYRLRPQLPATPGAECVGRVAAVGAGVGDFRPGDLVIHMQRENWVQRRRIPAAEAIPLPAGFDPAQAAMLRINPATALLLLEDNVALKPGDWVIQNVANSAVGRHLIVLATAKEVHTVNVVRRDDVAGELRALGADVVLADGPDLATRAQASTGGAPIRLGIDAVSGEACKRIADCVADGGVVASYGSMSGHDLVISRAAVGRGVTLKGFALGEALAKRTTAEVRAIYADLAGKVHGGALIAPIEATYPIDDIKAALAHAQRRGRNGKVLVLPNGPL
jgi:mitochondrial enoyl-[acyl-carrier protein] reductase / trans-2-enoyl-CoA reductase